MPAHHKMRAVRVGEFNWTQAQLAAASGVSTSTISDIECHRGPGTPRRTGRRRKTTTRLTTAIKLTVALEKLPPGEYYLEQFLVSQDVFGSEEMFRPKRRKRRHLRAVA